MARVFCEYGKVDGNRGILLLLILEGTLALPYYHRMSNACHSCLMPFSKDTGMRESDVYCSQCFRNGALTYTGTDRVMFQQLSYQAMVNKGFPKWKASLFAFLIRFAPRWRKSDHRTTA